ncbi:Rha family transcriptional regulator [uncultured Anaerococcus sp.]|uniref:Rha family transcriptional regulator n=1 Tax=uncultured Anaerococcus sp. TaxID=293428 RepID=UPI00288AA7CD|nr:Rha family transcriptional regulator [uncultured Anaerococcus sp.]
MNSLVQVKNDKNYGLITTSRIIAQGLSKEHSKVMRTLENLILETPDVASLIIPTTYKVKGQKREYKEYLLTKDGFTLYMFNIQGYNDFKMAYINEFNRMERLLNGEQLELEPYKLEKKTYKGKPVMTVRDLAYLTGDNKDNINWLVRSKSLGTLLNARTLRDFRSENNNISVYNRLNILFEDDVYKLIDSYCLNDDANMKINRYFSENSLVNGCNKGDIDRFLKVQKLIDLHRILYTFTSDSEMLGDFTEIISSKLVEIGLLDKPCRDLGINSKQGWNLGIKLDGLKKSILS